MLVVSSVISTTSTALSNRSRSSTKTLRTT
ncbi:hypothetical protein GECvBGOT_gp206 [Salmonella phage GEC_vB_GOT]|nr:hypothetical protein GECvBGOT_gp206 [Salmonella phage GEC_vB_GOT]